jgi:vacuolar-type H+-ATPase subunit H
VRRQSANSFKPVNKNSKVISTNLTELETLRSAETEAENKIRSAQLTSEKMLEQAEEESSTVMKTVRAKLMAELDKEYKEAEIRARNESKKLVEDAKLSSNDEKEKGEPRVQLAAEIILKRILEEG